MAASIFLLEFIVDDLIILRYPEGTNECDESCIEFNFLNTLLISICEKELGFVSRKYGKNCIFTLENNLGEEAQISINVHKQPCNEPKVEVGQGIIPIYKTFHTIFDLCLPQKNVGKVLAPRVSDSKKSEKSSEAEDKIDKNSYKSVDNEKKMYSKSQQSNSDSSRLDVGMKAKDNDSESSRKINSNNGQKNSRVTLSEPVTILESSPNLQVVHPATKSSKALYPIMNFNGSQVGVICVLMRITYFGSQVVSPFSHIMENSEFTMQCEDTKDKYNCSILNEENHCNGRQSIITRSVNCDDIFNTTNCYCMKFPRQTQSTACYCMELKKPQK